jgi:bifunctional enzyme CysN/CysC
MAAHCRGRGLPAGQRAEEPPALHHVRERGRRQVHAHRAAAVRVEDDLRRPAGGALAADSRKVGTRGGDLDFALLVDGLSAEREQGITIDVAYRFFDHAAAQVHRRRHARARAVHAQHGHRGVGGRSGRHPDRRAQGRADADAAAQLPGVAARDPPDRARRQQDGPDRLLADIFARIEDEYREFARRIGLEDITAIPISAVHGDNVVERTGRTPWYTGRP